MKQIEHSLQLNMNSLAITELEPDGGEHAERSFFSSDVIGEDCLSSKDFKQFSPIMDKDQVIVCKQTKQLVFFIPRSNHSFKEKSQDSLKRCLLDTLGKPSISLTQNVLFHNLLYLLPSLIKLNPNKPSAFLELL